jgi:hypothetical protein
LAQLTEGYLNLRGGSHGGVDCAVDGVPATQHSLLPSSNKFTAQELPLASHTSECIQQRTSCREWNPAQRKRKAADHMNSAGSRVIKDAIMAPVVNVVLAARQNASVTAQAAKCAEHGTLRGPQLEQSLACL